MIRSAGQRRVDGHQFNALLGQPIDPKTNMGEGPLFVHQGLSCLPFLQST
jgi:hypothetical protein